MDLIAIDVGNSKVGVAVFSQNRMAKFEHLDGARLEGLTGLLHSFRALCGPQPLGAKTVPVVVSSVNPRVLAVVEQAVAEALDQDILLIGRDVPLYMKLAIENPETIGSDRLLTAAAAYDVIERAVVVADFGTATTIDCVSDQGIFLGGAIMPGLGMAAKGLQEHTAALPLVEPALPDGEYGTNTVAAIQHGIYYSAIGALRELAERYATQLGYWPEVVITGGYGRLIAEKCDFINSYVPELCLNGLYLAYQKFRSEQESAQPEEV